MKTLFTALTTLTAAPALAHGSAHVHPHGSEAWLALALISVMGTLAYLLHRSRK
ncbi:peptidase M23 [Tropicibacter sp. Alg240-R139]|uniref:peptidase M23 n=1 Tax=Tropicibacter sp. Alg240-R139 TaxID=2305991 RepID=UPI0013E071C0|nr:peptidase M23 [Tropicibacter sp. Alg240-R139]